MSSDKSYSYGRQSIGADDIKAVTDVLGSDWLTQGPAVKAFEDALCQKFSAGHAAAVCNGTASLHLIGLALGWKPGAVVITSPNTFLASANCAVYAGAKPGFADIDPASYTIEPNRLEDRIKFHQARGETVKAVVAVDYAGHPCDWEGLGALAKRYGLQLVNDNCHALGAEYRGDYGYATKYADAVNHSYHPVKHITTGEGGAVLTNRKDVDAIIRTLRTHGMTKDEAVMERNDGPWYYEMHQVGFNYRITDFQSALGLTQLAKLDGFVKRRREIAAFYDRAFDGDTRFVTPRVSPSCKHAYHLYPLQINFDKLQGDRKQLFGRLKEANIHCQVHYIPVHLQPYYRKQYGYKPGDFPEAERFYSRELSIPMYPALTNEDLEHIAATIKRLAV